MMRRIIFSLAAVLLISVPVPAGGDTGAVAGPVLTYVNSAAGLRPLIGIPGSAYLGPVIPSDDAVIASISTRAGYALALAETGTQVQLLRLRGATRAGSVLAMFDAPVQSVRLSPDGSAAALVRGNAIDVFTGLPGNPKHYRTVSASSPPLLTAISDDGETVVTAEAMNLLAVYSADGRRELAATDLRHISFRPSTRDFVYVDGNTVISSSGANWRMLPASADDIVNVRAAFVSRDGQTVSIAGAASLAVINSATGQSARIVLPCAVSDVAPLDDATIGLTCGDRDQFHLIDVSGAAPRVFFVPAPER